MDLKLGKLPGGAGVECCHPCEGWFSTDAYNFLEHLGFHVPFQIYNVALTFISPPL